MSVSEAWDHAPCEIIRFLRARGEAEIEDRFEVGTIMALAFNDPKALSRQIREHEHAKRMARLANKEGVDQLVEFFQAAGHRVIDRTRG